MKKIILFLILGIFSTSFGKLEDYALENKKGDMDIKILQELRVTTLDPIDLSDIYSKRAYRYIYDTLFKVDELGNITPQLVKEYNYLDSKKLYIKLKEGIKFQDGTYLTSKDIKNSLVRVKEKGALKEFYKNIEDIEIISKEELIIKLSKEDNYLLNVLAHSMSSIVKIKDGKIIGTGKYEVESYQKDDLTLRNIENSNKKIIVDRVFSVKERMLSLYNNNSNIIYDISSYDIVRGKRLGIIDENKIDIRESENIFTSALIFNEQRDLSFKKNIEGLLEEKSPYIIPREIYGENLKKLKGKEEIKSIKKYINSLNKEERVIELMILNTEEDRELAKKIREDLSKGGVQVKIFPYQVDAFYYKLKAKDFDVALQHLVFNKKYPQISLGEVILYDIYDKNLYEDLSFYEERLEKTKNVKERKEIFIEGVNEISEKLPYIPLKHQPLYILFDKDIEL